MEPLAPLVAPGLARVPDDQQQQRDDGDDWQPQVVGAVRPLPAIPAVRPGARTSPVSTSIHADHRMDFTQQERQWALDIKRAIVGDPEMDNLSDYEYAQWALICHGDVHAAVERASHMQLFREEYGIDDTLEQSRHMVPRNLALLPGVNLSLSYNRRDGNYVFVYDIAAFDSKKWFKTPEGTQAILAGYYYLCHAMTPNLESIRRGVVLLCECSGFDLRKNIDVTTFRKLWCELGIAYPIDYQKVKYFNAGVLYNMINSLKKRFLPRKITDKMEIGCRFDGRLSDIYVVPDMDACNQRIFARIDECLQTRYNYMKSFTLSPMED